MYDFVEDKMPRKEVFKKKNANLLLEEVILLREDELCDDDLQELRWAQWEKEVERQRQVQAQEHARRHQWYFYWDGTCKNHDRTCCRECSRWAAGLPHPLEYL